MKFYIYRVYVYRIVIILRLFIVHEQFVRDDNFLFKKVQKYTQKYT